MFCTHRPTSDLMRLAPLSTSSLCVRPNGRSGLLLACPFLSPPRVSHFCRMFLLSWVAYCSHTELAGLPGLLLAAKPPNRFFMCLGLPRLSPSGLSVEQKTEGNQMKNRLGQVEKSKEHYFIKKENRPRWHI